MLLLCALAISSAVAEGKKEQEETVYRFVATHSWDLAQGRIDFEKQPNDRYFQWVEKTVGVVPRSHCYDWDGGKGYIEAVRLLIASGTIPEAIIEPYELSFVKELHDMGILIPLDKLVGEHAPDVMSQFTETDVDIIRSLAPDRKIYYLPNKTTVPNVGLIRKDWLQAVGMGTPRTRDQLFSAYRAFKIQDANGNGDANDEIPVSGRQGLRWCDDLFIMHGVHMFEGHPMWSWDAKKGEMVSHQVSDNMKMAIEFLRSLVAEGLMDRVMPIQSMNDWFAKLAADKIGHYFHTIGGIERRLAMRESGANPDAEWVYLPSVDVPGVPHQKNFQPGIVFPQLVITTAAKHPERILRWFNWNLTREGVVYNRLGIEGVNYRSEAGRIITEKLPVKQRYSYSHELAQEDEQYFLQSRYGEMKAAIYRACMNDTRERDDAGMPLSVYEDYEDYLPSNAKLYREYCSKMVLGELPMGAWDEYVRVWNQRGGTRVTARATDWYKKVHSGK